VHPSGKEPKRLFLVLALAWVASGCGPVEYLNQVTRRAAAAQAAAEKAEAEKLAPYEYWTGKEYLHKSRELAGYARFQLAIEYGRRAEEAALKARDIATEARTRRESPPPETGDSDAERPAPLSDKGAKTE